MIAKLKKMTHLFFENTTKIVQYSLFWFAFAVLQVFVLYPLVELPLWMIILDGFIQAIIYGLLGILLWSIIKYGNYAILSIQQQIINYAALSILTIGIWLGLGFSFMYLIVGNELTILLMPILPIEGFIGLLVYLLITQQFWLVFQQNKIVDEAEAIEIQEKAVTSQAIRTEQLERIAVKLGSKIHVVPISEILYLQADGDYVQIFTNEGKYLKEQTLKYFEEHLPENQFVRVHRSFIVNVEMISRIELYEKQNQMITLKNGVQIKTSPTGYKTLRSVLNL